MTGAVALTVVLVIAVVGISLAMQSQQGLPGQRNPRPASPRPPRVTPPRRTRERKPQPPAEDLPPASAASDVGDADLLRGPELLRSGEEAEAKVISVVDERTIGPVTRSRLTVQVDPGDGTSFEVTTRVAFPTPESRARVKVGGTVKVHYDKDDRTRVVVDIPPD